MAIDRLAVDRLHVIGEELGDVFVRAPVQRHAQVIAVLGPELVLDVLALEQVGTEPVQVGELLVGQLVHLAVRGGREAGTDEVLDVDARVRELLARAGHVVGQVEDLAVTIVRTDQVGVADPSVVDRLAGLHRGLQFFDDVAFLDEVVLQVDAGDFGEGLGQNLGLVFVRGDRFRNNLNFGNALRLQLGGGVDKPFHFRHLLVLRQGRWLEFTVNPLLGCGFICPGLSGEGACDGDC